MNHFFLLRNRCRTPRLFINFAAGIALLSSLLTGCRNQYVKIAQPPLFAARSNNHSDLSVKISDERPEKNRIGVLRGGFGNELGDVILAEDLSAAFRPLMTQALESAGYSIVVATNAVLDATIVMFVADTTGYGKYARHKVLVRLRDGQGNIRWEKTLLGEAAGMQMGTTASIQHCMNLALERLLHQAVEEFSGEYFAQTVRKINQGER